MEGEKLKKLKAQKAVLEARIRKEQGRESEKKRKADTRRKILAGAAVLDEAEGNPEYKAQLFKLLDKFLYRDDDRRLLGFEPLPESEKAKKAPLRNGLVSLEEPKKEGQGA